MIRVCKENREAVVRRINAGKIDAVALSTTSLIDEIILSMHKHKVLECLKDGFQDKRADNTKVSFYLSMALAVAAKMRVHSSLTDIPFALSDHRTLCELEYSLYDSDRNLEDGLMSEGTLRYLLGKYSKDEFINGYNDTIQKSIFPKLNLSPNIHILDCTKILVNPSNSFYEESARIKDEDGKWVRGYKLATLRGIIGDTGIIEDIRFGAINIHDLELSRDIILNSPMLKPKDIIINDRGFISREIINRLKNERLVDTYIPLRKNMEAYEIAVSVAKKECKWSAHPTKRRTTQRIAFVTDIGPYWRSTRIGDDVPLNACVVWDQETDHYSVFITTDTSKTAKQIIQTYELRVEAEEDYRQLKDFWNLEGFRSRKINIITFHIVCVLLGYMFFQLYTLLPEGGRWSHKSLPVIQKTYNPIISKHIVIYAGYTFGILTLLELMKIYAECDGSTKAMLDPVFEATDN